jgi:hypothetical protein
MMREPVEESGRHLCIAEDTRPLAEGEVGCDDDGGLFVEPADEVEEQLAASLGEGQVAESQAPRGSSTTPSASGSKPSGAASSPPTFAPARSRAGPSSRQT